MEKKNTNFIHKGTKHKKTNRRVYISIPILTFPCLNTTHKQMGTKLTVQASPANTLFTRIGFP